MKREFKAGQLGIYLLLGLATAGLLEGRNLFFAPSAQEVYGALCNAAFVPGVLLLSFGLLLFVANDGVFNIFGYAFQQLTYIFRSREKRAALPHTYYDYVVSKRGTKQLDLRPLFLAGVLFMALATLFLILYENAA